VRGTIDELRSRYPIGRALPGLYQDDRLAQRFTEGLDVVLAPVVTTLDCIEAYIDPRLAPIDFVEWLAGWVGVELEGSWPVERRRALVARAAELFAWRGTRRGVRELVATYTGIEPDIEESGGTGWVNRPPEEAPAPQPSTPSLVVRLRVPAGQRVELALVDRLVAASKPAHVSHRVEIEHG